MTNAILKQDLAGNWMVLDKRSGQFLVLRGANEMKSSPFFLDSNIDLTKPIAEQAFLSATEDVYRRSTKG